LWVVSCVQTRCTMGRKNLSKGLIGLEYVSPATSYCVCPAVPPAYGPWRCCTSCAVMLVCETSYTRYMMYEVITHRPAHSAHESETYLPMYYVRRRSSDLLMYHVLLRPLLKHNSPRIQSQIFSFICMFKSSKKLMFP
jgi:hypothetical protein